VRPSRAKPKQGWSLRQLAALTGTTERGLKHYLEVGVLPRPPFRGPATRYQRLHLLWILGAQRLQSTESLSLAEIGKRLGAMPPAELEAFVLSSVPPGPAAHALGLVPAPAAPVAVAAPVSPAPAAEAHGAPPALAPAPALAPGTPRWVRIELALGLELNVREDASPRVLELAERIRGFCP